MAEGIGLVRNYNSGQSSEDDDKSYVGIEKRYNALDELSAEYDHLSSTPPRTRIRNKEKHKCFINEILNSATPHFPRVIRRNTTDNITMKEANSLPDCLENKRAKRRSLKTIRGHERDLKLDIEKCRESHTEPTPPKSLGLYTITKLVESNNRFKSLHSQPVCHASRDTKRHYERPPDEFSDLSILDSRTNFHSTFSMLIKLGNSDKNCKRTISMEEHTWQNELKDLIWLEVSAKRAGRTATQQDAFLLSHRDTVPLLLQRILDYKFIYPEKRCKNSGIWTTQTSVTSADSGIGNQLDENVSDNENFSAFKLFPRNECLCVDCPTCLATVGLAMHQIENLLDSLAEAEALYPSCKTMAAQHPVIMTNDFINKTKAMCLWYNMAHHQRLKILILRKLLYKDRWKYRPPQNKKDLTSASTNECVSKDNQATHKQKVKFILGEDKISNRKQSVKFLDDISSVDDETDDDNDVQQSSTIHIKITETQTIESNLTDYETGQSSRDSTKSTTETPQLEKGFLNVHNIKSKGDNSICEDICDSPNSDHSRSPYESTDSTAGSVNSNESGFISSVNENQDYCINYINKHEFDVYKMGPLGDLTKLRLYNPKLTSPYRDYIEKMLKVRGLKRALYFLEKLHVGVLKKARMTLERYKENTVSQNGLTENGESDNEVVLRNHHNVDSSDDDFEYERHTRCEVDIDELKKECSELRKYGAWSKETLNMCLPSYRSTFLFLSTVPIEIIHEFLLMRLETKPEKASALSIKQLIHELREGLAIAVKLRGRYTRHVNTALVFEPVESKHRKFYEKVISTFDNALNEVYKLYLSYLSDWAGMEYLPRSILTAEWTFNRNLAQNLKLAATISPLTFCCLTVRQLEAAAERLKSRVSELGKKAESLVKDDNPDNSLKLCILRVCRDLQYLLSEEREKALSTAQFARTVSMHLYHNDVFKEYRQKIYKAMVCVQNVLCWTIDQMQEATSQERLLGLDECDRPSVLSRTKEIVSQGYKFGFEFHKEMCRLINEDIAPDCMYNLCGRNSISVSRKSRLTRADSVNYDHTQISVDDNYYNPYTPISTQEFLFNVPNSRVANKNQSRDEEALSYSLCGHKGLTSSQSLIGISKKYHKFHTSISAKELSELKHEDFQNGIPGCESCSKKIICDDGNSYTCVLKGDKDMSDWEVIVSRSVVQFAKQWMNFAVKRCERGRGLRPRWANHGLDFLMLTCHPQHTKHLSDEEFEELKAMMDECISHVIGSSGGININNSITTPILINTPPSQRLRFSPLYSQSPLSNKTLQISSPPTPIESINSILQMENDEIDSIRRNKKLEALENLDCQRDEALRRAGAIGVIRQGTGYRDHFRPRPVTFKWQRGIKIGQGRFGKVYTVVNTESGQLLAMKEVSLGIGDRRAVDRAANELQVLEGVVHPNLVRYYGVEIHREEMLIFMELCVEGSLENMIAGCSNTTDGLGSSGLPEQLIRRYTGQLVSAVRALHDRSIVHRDIKSGNIFLTEGGNCLKLGDFGCAVKIRANTTVPGELQGYIGTQAYMAPEVFMKSSGHGRAADIWSLGCVVVEMATGKRPWSEYDSNYQIMFVVGMGNRPEIPPTLSNEGTDFCLACLQHDPTVRATAERLSRHHFLKVNRAEYD